MISTDSALVVLFTLMLILSGIPVSGQGVTPEVNLRCSVTANIDVTPNSSSDGAFMCEVENPTSNRIKGNVTITSNLNTSWDFDELFIEPNESVFFNTSVIAIEGASESQHQISVTFTVNQVDGDAYSGTPTTWKVLMVIMQYNNFNISTDYGSIIEIGDEEYLEYNLTNLGNALTRFNILIDDWPLDRFNVSLPLVSIELERNATETIRIKITTMEIACDDNLEFYEENLSVGIWASPYNEPIQYYPHTLSTTRCIPDSDSDGLLDSVDFDDDGDGWSDFDENFCESDSLNSSSVPIDSDSDGICDSLDDDNDNDGILDQLDYYPLDPGRFLAEPKDDSNSSIIVILLLVIATLLIVILLSIKNNGKRNNF